jgi:hypothetical protein
MEPPLTEQEENIVQVIRQNYIGLINEFLDLDMYELEEINMIALLKRKCQIANEEA